MLISSAICDGCTFSPVPMRPNAAIMPSTVPNRPKQRAALDDRGDPVGAVLEVAHHVALQDFGDDLPQLVVAQLAIGDGQVRELRQGPGVVGAQLLDGVVAAVSRAAA